MGKPEKAMFMTGKKYNSLDRISKRIRIKDNGNILQGSYFLNISLLLFSMINDLFSFSLDAYLVSFYISRKAYQRNVKISEEHTEVCKFKLETNLKSRSS